MITKHTLGFVPRRPPTPDFLTITFRNMTSHETTDALAINLDLKGRRALVGGASKGIGKACASVLAAMGANVTVMARNAASLQQVVSSLPVRDGQQHWVLEADVQRPDELCQRVENHVETAGGFHIVINNTAGPAAGNIVESSVSQLSQTFADHVLLSHRLMLILRGYMVDSGWGRVINIISTSVKSPLEGLGVSNTVRGAMASWSKTLATELAPYGITVNSVLPGATATERLASIIDRKAQGRSVAEVEAEMLAEIPMGRFAKPEEIAAAVGFLASPAAGYITGTSILVDGGRTRALS
jgi:3-oxoacyl-[acyl-carrier protein] reductase